MSEKLGRFDSFMFVGDDGNLVTVPTNRSFQLMYSPYSGEHCIVLEIQRESYIYLFRGVSKEQAKNVLQRMIVQIASLQRVISADEIVAELIAEEESEEDENLVLELAS